jgi:hypothetical protein
LRRFVDGVTVKQMQGQSPSQKTPRKKVYAARPYRISCGGGRAIVAYRFNRVQVIECSGRIVGQEYQPWWSSLLRPLQ